MNKIDALQQIINLLNSDEYKALVLDDYLQEYQTLQENLNLFVPNRDRRESDFIRGQMCMTKQVIGLKETLVTELEKLQKGGGKGE